MKEIEWTEASLEEMAALDKGIARRVKQAIERFAGTGAGNVKRLQGIDPTARPFAFSMFGTAARLTAEQPTPRQVCC